jgi:hypothetical protein
MVGSPVRLTQQWAPPRYHKAHTPPSIMPTSPVQSSPPRGGSPSGGPPGEPQPTQRLVRETTTTTVVVREFAEVAPAQAQVVPILPAPPPPPAPPAAPVPAASSSSSSSARSGSTPAAATSSSVPATIRASVHVGPAASSSSSSRAPAGASSRAPAQARLLAAKLAVLRRRIAKSGWFGQTYHAIRRVLAGRASREFTLEELQRLELSEIVACVDSHGQSPPKQLGNTCLMLVKAGVIEHVLDARGNAVPGRYRLLLLL